MVKLLLLPDLARREILIDFDPIQIVELSLLSRRAQGLAHREAQSPIMRKTLTMSVSDCDRKREIVMFFQNCGYHFRIHKIGGRKMKGCYLNGFVTGRRDDNATDVNERPLISFDSYWDDAVKGLNEMVKYISILFNYPEVSSLWSGNNNLPLTQWVIEKMERKVKFYEINVRGINVTHAVMKTHLNSCESAYDRIYFAAKTTRNFQYNFDFNARELTIEFSNWITFNNIVQLSDQVESLSLRETYSTHQDLNNFLKYWLSIRTTIKMCHLVAYPKDLNVDELFQGIAKVPRENPESSIVIITVQGHFDIHREDGAKATIFAARRYYRSPAPFGMYIWPSESTQN
ncbi:hypothetical protein CAEBREN_00247 [Caenorhabditis brenneri]|uniref:F-box domain-containing protein n=1 Tax=Caenorhabditis brenneri TaxID=135651 RepID=G0MBU9_CAEBE|nr:hypothetical protein CAEBREN_00247 [Caenorhabditis brenneri]